MTKPKPKPAPVVRAEEAVITAVGRCMKQGFLFDGNGKVFMRANCVLLEHAYANYLGQPRSKP